MKIEDTGKVSEFGGPDDMGVAEDEDLAFIYKVEDHPDLFLSYQPEGTTGLARRLNPKTDYVAYRWPYTSNNKAEWRELLLTEMALVTATKTGKSIKAYPADWGPHDDTDRILDVSPHVLEELGITTDDEVTVIWPYTHRTPQKPHAFESIVISSGHGLKVRGASGVIDEVDEARKVVEEVAAKLRDRGVNVKTFHDNVSTTQSENLTRIVDYHNAQNRQLDVSIHFNAYVETTKPMGTECLWVTQKTLAQQVAQAIAECGFILRGDAGAVERTDLKFLNQTTGPSILIEVCFVDSEADADVYLNKFEEVCEAIATVLGGAESRVAQ